MICMWLTGAALAGNVYLNGTFIDPIQVAGLEMEDVDVRIDNEGNIHIDAPGYKVEVMAPPAPAAYGAPTPAASQYGAPAPAYDGPPPAPATAYSAPARQPYGAPAPQPYGAPAPQPYAAPAPQPYAAPAPQPYTAPQPYGAPAPPQPYAAPAPQPYGAPAAAMNPNGLAKASWWLVTEDNNTGGHTIEVVINDQVAHTLRSGQPQQIVDISAFLIRGINTIVVKSNSSAATGGTLYVFIGPGNDQSGTVVMDHPEIQFGVGSSRTGPYQREYSITVN